ncbi:hypothetical protein LZ318_05700 [Saccharopolyspora indica]|uniref:hypothetical protein n=1 Tax=Saccharopolyspora indica TaxID=1229659 RepID=UPI0022EAE96C|nr:hypothetical protein [Saccharopolyspora indica]MDA3646047.1 hypothetical protein [Saccharopolyspora indica]
MALAVMLAGGCFAPAIEPFEMPGGGDEEPSIPAEASLGPVKHVFADFPSCREIQQRVPGLDLVEGSQDEEKGSSRTCHFNPAESGSIFIGLEVSLYGGREDADGFQSGAERARAFFTKSAISDAERDGSVDFGAEAHWTRFIEDTCTLEVLDENAVITATYHNPRARDKDPRSSECRDGARDVARKFYAAVQP